MPATVNANLKLLLCLFAATPPLAAEDRISLKDGSTLRGNVRAIEGDHKIVVDSEFSSDPIELRGSALRSISFDVETGEHHNDPELLHLVNGDVLPGSLRALDDRQILFRTWYADDLTIERTHIRSVDFGVTPQKLVYVGPKPLSEWIDNDDWEWENGKLTCNTSGTIAAKNVLPRQFILRFRLEWESGPNFRIYFCDDFLKRTGNADRYYFEINSMGSQLKRQTAEGGRRWHTLAQSHRMAQGEFLFDGAIWGHAMVHPAGQVANFRIERPSHGDVHFLKATANAQERLPPFHTSTHQGQGDRITGAIKIAMCFGRVFSVFLRVHIGPTTGQQKPVKAF